MVYTATIITGVAGSGKSSLGLALSAHWGYDFHDGDDFHPPPNILKMQRGQPLNDTDRAPWLAAIRDFLQQSLQTRSVIIACSALKASYRQALLGVLPPQQLRWIHLQGDPNLILARMQQREGHFMPPALLQSQLATYEPPSSGLIIDIAQPLEAIVQTIDQTWK